ncbi:MAG: hypothetical protein UIM27_02915, partial [Acutalibacteraceae bacterium]|nr:hypothetical protein [Acutalibacteraceae bacterium]
MKLLIDIFSDKIIVKKDGSSKLENRLSLSKKLSFRWAFFDKSGKIEAGDKNDREKQKKQRANGNIQYRRIC